MSRLRLARLADLPSEIARPAYDPAGLPVGIVHLGIGAFHRAHQAVAVEAALHAVGGPWGICGVTQRRSTVMEQLAPQDGLFSVWERGEGAAPPRVVGAVRELLQANRQPDEVRTRIGDARVRIVSLTVTEKGYRADLHERRLRIDDPDVAADLSADEPGRTVVGQLVGGLRARMRADAGPVTVLSCDNLPSNGALLQGLVEQFCAAWRSPDRDEVRGWIARQVTFPSTLVDRIAPATTAADLDRAERQLGMRDEGAVVTEPYHQWVIEDCFASERPAWEQAGVTLAADVGPYEAVKLRLLNGGHSLLAYLGCLAACARISDTLVEPAFEAALRGLMAEAAAALAATPPDLDLREYQEQVAHRFANSHINYRVEQVAADGSQKLPQRLLATVRARAERGWPSPWAGLGVAAWMQHVAERGPALQDPLAPRLASLAGPATSARALVDALLSVREVFGDDLPEQPAFRAELIRTIDTLQRYGPRTAAALLA